MIRLVVAAALLLVVVACSSDSTEVGIQPIDPILASDIEFDFDPSGTAATVNVETNIPVACAIIFGTDDNYGSIAVDNDMQGGAHHDHGPVLTSLAPDTEYRYILQGSDAAGTLYRSEQMTFITPPAAENALGRNVAPTGTITAFSSEFSDAFAAANAIDGDLGTEWSTAGDGDDAFIEIDLGQPYDITAVAFRTRQMSDGTAITNTFTVTIDDEEFGPYPTGTDPASFESAVGGRIVRVDATDTTGGNTGAVEIEIFATA